MVSVLCFRIVCSRSLCAVLLVCFLGVLLSFEESRAVAVACLWGNGLRCFEGEWCNCIVQYVHEEDFVVV